MVDLALTRDANTSETTLANRAKAILLIGAIMKSIQADEDMQERRELERLVAETAARKKAGYKKGSKITASTNGISPTAP